MNSVKRILSAAGGALLLALVLMPGLAGASHGSDAGESRDFAVGGGTTVTGDPSDPTGVQRVDFAASGGPTTVDPLGSPGGEPVAGHFRAGGEFDPAGVSEFQQEGPVTCLVVEGNRARLVYPLRQATPEMNEDLEVLIFLEDNGAPQNGQPDRLGFVLLPDETPDDDPPSERDSECVLPPVTPTLSELRRGNFTIHDAP